MERLKVIWDCLLGRADDFVESARQQVEDDSARLMILSASANT